MSDLRSALLFRREDRVPLALVVVLAASFHVVLGSLAIGPLELTYSNFGLFYDGHLYIEIAKSFPLPFGSGARDYMGHAPGYPALIALVRWGSAVLNGWRGCPLPQSISLTALLATNRARGLSPITLYHQLSRRQLVGLFRGFLVRTLPDPTP